MILPTFQSVGFLKGNVNNNLVKALQHHLQNSCELIQVPKNIEFVIRETKRKYQHSIAELSLWRRNYLPPLKIDL